MAEEKPWFREFRDKGERSTRHGEHVPVLFEEVISCLNPQAGQVAIDCTLGFAGHSSELLKRIGPSGKLLAFDADANTIPLAEQRLKEIGNPYIIHHGNFAGIQNAMLSCEIEKADCLLADLGMSSMQLDDPKRGFSYARNGPLDMRLNTSKGQTAAEILNSYDEEELAKAFHEFGDEPEAVRIAEAIVQERKVNPFQTTSQLKAAIQKAAPVTVVKSPGMGPPEKQKMRPTVRVFQALRILVNREIRNLEQLLRSIPHILKPNGKVAIISFHSGEDRLVKKSFQEGIRNGLYSEISDEPIRPSENEKGENPRSRSAKLRWAKII